MTAPRQDANVRAHATTERAARYIALVDRVFWQDRLEVDVGLAARQCATPGFLEGVLAGLTTRCQHVVAEGLAIPARRLARDPAAGLPEDVCNTLFPLILVDRFGEGKRSQAIVDIAQAHLPKEEFFRLTGGSERIDRRALLWRLYIHGVSSLELVFHVDRLHRHGVARYVLAEAPPPPARAPADFFVASEVQHALDAFEGDRNTLRVSVCASALRRDDTFVLFIKRESRSSFVAKGPTNVFGFEREWLTLRFDADLRRVRLSSLSPDVPLILANALASAYFGRPIDYVEDATETPVEAVHAFLQAIVYTSTRLPVVELQVREARLPGEPAMRLSDGENLGLSRALHRYARALGDPLVPIENVASLKIYAFGKRIKLLLEPVVGRHAFIVRYADQPLVERERRELEATLRDDFGIVAVSTEKRRAR